MPHVIVKLWPGKSEQQKKKLAEEVTKAVMSTLNYGEESVSVGIEEVKPQDWTDQVYKPDILGKTGDHIQGTGIRALGRGSVSAALRHAALDGFDVRGVKSRSEYGTSAYRTSAPPLYFRAERRAVQDRGN